MGILMWGFWTLNFDERSAKRDCWVMDSELRKVQSDYLNNSA
jgi:hypothetical protein